MTIALGFNCSDGVVLCADQQITAEGWHKFNECKMYAVTGGGEDNREAYTVMLTYAGNPHAMKTLHEKFSGVGEEHFSSLESVKLLLEGFLSELPSDQAESTNFLCGFCRQGGIGGLLRTNGCLVHEVIYDHIGTGDSSLVRFLSKLLVLGPMRAWNGVFIGHYIIKLAKEFIDGCGGPTDIYVLRDNGRAVPPWEQSVDKSASAAEAIERDIRRLLWLSMNASDQSKIDSIWDDVKQRTGEFFLGTEPK